MIREVDLVQYLPPFMQQYREPSAALEAENPEFALEWKAADKVFKNRFISTADADGLARFEKMMGLFPSAGDSLDLRRFKVMVKWLNSLPYTLRTLLSKLTQICGEDYVVRYDFETGYWLDITTYLASDNEMEEIKNLVMGMVPLNISITVVNEVPLKGLIYAGGIIQTADLVTLEQRR